MIAVTRQMFELAASIVADSIVVFGSATAARLSHDLTALAPAIAGFGAVCMSAGAANPPAGGPPRPGWGACACPADTRNVTTAAEARRDRLCEVMGRMILVDSAVAFGNDGAGY